MQAPTQLLGTGGAKGALPSLPEVIGLCLSHLPLYDDVVEARTVHRQVCTYMSIGIRVFGCMVSLGALVRLIKSEKRLHKIQPNAPKRQLADFLEAALAQPPVLSALLGAESGFQNAALLLQAVAATVKVKTRGWGFVIRVYVTI